MAEGQGVGWGGGGGGAHQVAADPCIDQTESQDSELEELCAAVAGQEAQAARQNAAGERHGHRQTASQRQSHPALQ